LLEQGVTESGTMLNTVNATINRNLSAFATISMAHNRHIRGVCSVNDGLNFLDRELTDQGATDPGPDPAGGAQLDLVRSGEDHFPCATSALAHAITNAVNHTRQEGKVRVNAGRLDMTIVPAALREDVNANLQPWALYEALLDGEF
jgi:hypothetical protein